MRPSIPKPPNCRSKPTKLLIVVGLLDGPPDKGRDIGGNSHDGPYALGNLFDVTPENRCNWHARALLDKLMGVPTNGTWSSLGTVS
jgi:hypothetical protein